MNEASEDAELRRSALSIAKHVDAVVAVVLLHLLANLASVVIDARQISYAQFEALEARQLYVRANLNGVF